jgi:hypothetical protein
LVLSRGLGKEGGGMGGVGDVEKGTEGENREIQEKRDRMERWTWGGDFERKSPHLR